MLNFDFSDKFLGLVFHHILCIIFQEKYFPCYVLLTDQISLPGYLYILRDWTICVLQLFVNQVVTSQILKLTLFFQSGHFLTWGNTELVCWSTGPTNPILRKSKKIILQNFGLFYNLLFSVFWKKQTWQTYIYNQGQEAFIVIIISYGLRVFLLCLLCKIFFWGKYRP